MYVTIPMWYCCMVIGGIGGIGRYWYWYWFSGTYSSNVLIEPRSYQLPKH